MTNIVVVDYGVGNITSICRALHKYGAKVEVTSDELRIMAADGVVLPGVGAFAHGMQRLKHFGIDDTLRKYSETNKPILGICLGMQMLFDGSSEFGNTEGIGLIPGFVNKLETYNKRYEKLPHVSWNEIMGQNLDRWNYTVLDDIKNSADMYFVHSYYVKPTNTDDVLSTSIYSDFEFCSTVKRNNIYGCQYHPEKSGECGLKIISNFINICEENYEY